MKIHLAHFTEGEPSEVTQDYDPKALELEFVDLKYLEPVHLTGVVEKGADNLQFHGQLTGKIEQICGRCLKTLKSNFSEDFDLYYEIKEKEDLDTTDDLREILMLDHQLSYLCNENCKGLCPQCGADLNQGTCKCRPKDASHPLGSLKDIFDRSKKENQHGKS